MIVSVVINDIRFPLDAGSGSDAIHTDPIYSYSVVQLIDSNGKIGIGLTFTLGEGNDLVCRAASYLASKLPICDIEELMLNFGNTFRIISNDQQFRWLGPHKGVTHLALAAVTNACFDLWAKSRGVPLWKLLIDLTPDEIVSTLDFSYIEDVLTKEEAKQLLVDYFPTRKDRMGIIKEGYPGYDTSVGWYGYDDKTVERKFNKSIENGFSAIKLKVGGKDFSRDIQRAYRIREVAGDDFKIMLDANQQWSVAESIEMGSKFQGMNPFWIEEPTHPDDVFGHATIKYKVPEIKLATGEHVSNRIVFKNYLKTGSISYLQPDALRVGGVSEFITVSLLAKKYNIPILPHVGDMGQLHQHLVLFNHICLNHDVVFLEHIPHLQKKFVNPVRIINGRYQTPYECGSSCDLSV